MGLVHNVFWIKISYQRKLKFHILFSFGSGKSQQKNSVKQIIFLHLMTDVRKATSRQVCLYLTMIFTYSLHLISKANSTECIIFAISSFILSFNQKSMQASWLYLELCVNPALSCWSCLLQENAAANFLQRHGMMIDIGAAAALSAVV